LSGPGELRAAEWAEIDLDAGVWSIPGEKMKMKRPHRVPLAPRAIASCDNSERSGNSFSRLSARRRVACWPMTFRCESLERSCRRDSFEGSLGAPFQNQGNVADWKSETSMKQRL
jgi:integrase